MGGNITIKKGLDIKLAGEAGRVIRKLPLPETFAIKPTDFPGVVPKLFVQPGDEVKAGTPLFCDKNNELVKFCSPVSGEVAEIIRGEKRRLLEIRILADKEINYLSFTKTDPLHLDRDQVLEILLNYGAWPLIRQRPFG